MLVHPTRSIIDIIAIQHVWSVTRVSRQQETSNHEQDLVHHWFVARLWP